MSEQTRIPNLGTPPPPKFSPEGEVPEFRAKNLAFKLPGPLAMMLGPDGGEQVAAGLELVLGWATRLGGDLSQVVRELRELRQEQLYTQRELVRIQILLSPEGERTALEAFAADNDAWEME